MPCRQPVAGKKRCIKKPGVSGKYLEVGMRQAVSWSSGGIYAMKNPIARLDGRSLPMLN